MKSKWMLFTLLATLVLAGPGVVTSIALADAPAAAPAPPDAAPAATPLPAGTKTTDPATGKPGVVATPAAAPGGAAPTPETSIGDIVAAARAGKWLVAIGGALILLTALLRWLAAKANLPWFATDRGGAVLVGATSLLMALGTTLVAPGAHLDFTTFAAALAVTWSAAGGYSWLKKLFGSALPDIPGAGPPALPVAKTVTPKG